MKNCFMIVMTKEEIEEFKEIMRKQHKIRMGSKEAAREYLIKIGLLTPDGRIVGWFKELYGLDKSYDDVRF